MVKPIVLFVLLLLCYTQIYFESLLHSSAALPQF